MSNRSQGCSLEGPLSTVWRCGLFKFFGKGIYLFPLGCDFRILRLRLKGVYRESSDSLLCLGFLFGVFFKMLGILF